MLAKLEEPPAVPTTKNDMALSINDLPSSAEINSYILLVLYDYSLQRGCLSVIEPHVQQVISRVQNVLPFGQLYGILLLTKLFEAHPQEMLQVFIETHFIERFVNLLELNTFTQHETQLIDMVFAALKDTQLTLTSITKQQLVELLSRQF